MTILLTLHELKWINDTMRIIMMVMVKLTLRKLSDLAKNTQLANSSDSKIHVDMLLYFLTNLLNVDCILFKKFLHVCILPLHCL